VDRWGSVITDDGRKEPVFRATGDFEDYRPAHPEASEGSGTRGYLKWLLIFLFGLPLGIATIAFATVAVLYFIR
jgi:hypothetical protein